MIRKYFIYAFTAALLSTSVAAQGLFGDSVKRTGVLHYINVAERRVVIDDHNFKLSPSARLTSAVTRRSIGKPVSYTLVGQGGGVRGVIVKITRAPKKRDDGDQ